MIKVHIISDLHLEFGDMELTPVDCDIILLPGDIHLGFRSFKFAEKLSLFHNKPVLMTTGNHEYYKQRSIQDVEDNIKTNEAITITKAQYLQQTEYLNHELEIRVLGCTLWTDYNMYNTQDISMIHANESMNDYEVIPDFSVYSAFAWHKKNLNWLKSKLKEKSLYKTIVMTHHGPSTQSIAKEYENNKLNPCYVSRLEYLMDDLKYPSAPVLWVHGHIHSSLDYKVFNTRVICNPRGYVRYELNPNFNSELVITI